MINAFLCKNIDEEKDGPFKWNPSASLLHIHRVCFAIEEYQRRHTLIGPNVSNYII
jgi:hypothetical protein